VGGSRGFPLGFHDSTAVEERNIFTVVPEGGIDIVDVELEMALLLVSSLNVTASDNIGYVELTMRFSRLSVGAFPALPTTPALEAAMF
jgi:hypothetical protein